MNWSAPSVIRHLLWIASDRLSRVLDLTPHFFPYVPISSQYLERQNPENHAPFGELNAFEYSLCLKKDRYCHNIYQRTKESPIIFHNQISIMDSWRNWMWQGVKNITTIELPSWWAASVTSCARIEMDDFAICFSIRAGGLAEKRKCWTLIL